MYGGFSFLTNLTTLQRFASAKAFKYLCKKTENLMKDFQLLIYSTPTEDIKVDVVLKDEDIWASQKAMAALFGVQIPDISKHINNIFESGELDSSTTVSKMETVVQRGFRGQVPDQITLYSLDMIIAVGYRVSSARATSTAALFAPN